MTWSSIRTEPLPATQGAERSPTANIRRLEQFLDAQGLDVVVARSGVNFTYLAGFEYSGTLGRHLDLSDSPRGVVVIWPRHGDPLLIVNEIAAPKAQRDSVIRKMRVLDPYGDRYERQVASILTELGLADGRVGAEKSVLSAESWDELGNAMPQADLVDCTEMMHRVRWVKTEGELELITAGARLLDEVYLEVLPQIRPGDTERDIHAHIVSGCISKGASWAHGILNSSRNTVLYGGEGDFQIEEGDIVRNDYVSWYHGYPGHQSRPVVVGAPTTEQIASHRAVRDIYRATVEFARPGVAAREIYRFTAKAFSRAGFAGQVPLAGHGVGPWWHQQPPFLVPSSSDVLEEGMVIAFEPHVNEYHIQDMFLILEGGNEILSPGIDTSELLIANG